MASALKLIKVPLIILDVLSGVKVSALNAQKDGSSMHKISVMQSVISAQPGTQPQENVIHATMDQLSSMEPVLPIKIPPSLQ